MKTDRELLEQALEALRREYGGEPLGTLTHRAIIQIMDRLAEDEIEVEKECVTLLMPESGMGFTGKLVHTNPQPKARLTDEEIRLIVKNLVSDVTVAEAVMFRDVARAIEQKIWGDR